MRCFALQLKYVTAHYAENVFLIQASSCDDMFKKSVY